MCRFVICSCYFIRHSENLLVEVFELFQNAKSAKFLKYVQDVFYEKLTKNRKTQRLRSYWDEWVRLFSASSFLKHNIVRIERQKFEVLKKLLVDKKSQ